jgi:hypothetical protein
MSHVRIDLDMNLVIRKQSDEASYWIFHTVTGLGSSKMSVMKDR